MTAKQTALASLDIMSEGLAQQDGLAERLTRQRSSKSTSVARAPKVDSPPPPALERVRESDSVSTKNEHNAWRRGKGLIQVAVDEDIHMELGIIGKRRRLGLSRLTRDALNLWLETHGYSLRIPG
jgi:uncharacterized protein YkwD